MNLGQIRDIISAQLGDGYQRYFSAYLDVLINRGESFVAEYSHCLKGIFEHPTTEDQPDYNLNNIGGTGEGKTLAVTNVLYGEVTDADPATVTDWNRLALRDFWEQDKISNTWRTADADTPTVAIIWGHFLWLYPKPPRNGTWNLRVEVIKLPAEKTSDSDDLEVSEKYFDDIIHYVLAFINKDMRAIYAMQEILSKHKQEERGKKYYIKRQPNQNRWI